MSKRELESQREEDEVEDAEIGDDEQTNAQAVVLTDTNRKRQQQAAFSSWFTKQAKGIAHDGLTKVLKTEDEESLSIKAIMARQESEIIIASPRDYQMELFEKAKNENTIAVLDTGSGKTLIAVLLLRHIIDQELEHRVANRSKRVSFFLVDKVALVFQQYAVLKANLSQDIERVCGAMGTDLWTADVWRNLFDKNMVIVGTADVLLHCLNHAFITIEQINLLVFDEAHHAKKGHAYARIIKEHYLHASEHKRPRIFGMTASPVDIGTDDIVDLHEKAKELEVLLNARIVTNVNSSLLQQAVHRPKPVLFKYHSYPTPFITPFYRGLWNQYQHVKAFEQIFQKSKEASNQLGAWCSDAYWIFAFSDAQAKKMEMKVQQRSLGGKDLSPTQLLKLDQDIIKLREAQEVVKHHDFGIPAIDPATFSLSPKVIKLYEMLQQVFNDKDSTKSRCIVFVEKRYSAKLLKMVFDLIGGEHLRAGLLVGAGSGTVQGMKYSLKEQVVTLMKFRKGDINCLFATSVAEEGLDIQDCNIIIRFDPAKTMIQYVQSRGRGRSRDAKFWHLVNNSLEEHERLITLVRAEAAMRDFCQKLPADRRLLADEVEREHAAIKESAHRSYVETSTGAKLTYDFALVVLAHFVNCLPYEDGDDLSINYVVTSTAGRFVCEVILPSQSPIRSAVGKEATRKSIARRSAAFEACLALRRGKYLDAMLLPIYARQAPAMRNALLALSEKASNSYYMQAKPSLWAESRGTVPESLYVNIIHLSGAWDRPIQSLALLTRQRLPDIPVFPVYRIDGEAIAVTIKSHKAILQFATEQITMLTSFLLRIYKDVFNKTFEHNDAQMSYWVAPLVDGGDEPCNAMIDWAAVAKVHLNQSEKWSPKMSNDSLIDKFLVDPFDGGRRLFTKAIEKHMKATDPVPEGVAPGGKTDSIISYSVKLWKASRLKRTWDVNQPVVVADKIQHRLNILTVPNEAEQAAITHCYICPEPMEISQLSTRVAAMALLFPAILHRIEAYLIAIEHCEEVGLKITTPLALEAITKDSENSEDANAEKINFQHGMGPNYERLELIGDAFLKMATSLSIFVNHMSIDEFQMHVSRMLLLCNKNLFDHAREHGRFKYIRSQAFSRRTWYPEGLRLLSGKGAKNTALRFDLRHNLGAKTIADVCEAMIGAAFVTHFTSGCDDPSQMDEAVKATTIFVDSKDHTMKTWQDYSLGYHIPAYQIGEGNASQRDLAERIRTSHNYSFKYPRLLRSAFLHPSVPKLWEGLPSYQRLEFLGDALLDMTAVTYLWYKYPTADPQWLTEHKMAMVSNRFLGAVCIKLGFHRHLRHNTQSIESQVRLFAEELEAAEERAAGAKDYWTGIKEAPKCLADIVEAYVGAMFIDSGFKYSEVQRFFDEHIRWFFEDMSIYDTYANNHPVTRVYKLLSETFNCQDFRLMADELPADNVNPAMALAGLIVHDEMLASGQAQSARYAKIKASIEAWDRLKGLSTAEFKARYGCDCNANGAPKKMDELVGAVI